MAIELPILDFAFVPLSDDDEGREENRMDLEDNDLEDEDELEDAGAEKGDGAGSPKDDDDEDGGVAM